MNKLSILLIFIVLFSVTAQKSFAQQKSISISPPIIKLRLSTALALTRPFIIANHSSDKVNINILFNLLVKDKYSDQLIIGTKTSSNIIDCCIEVLDKGQKISNLSLDADSSKQLDIRFNLSKNTKSGDYYISIGFKALDEIDQESSKSRISIAPSITVLLSVDYKNSHPELVLYSTPLLNFNNSVNFKIELVNDNDWYNNVSGYISIKDIFGNEISKIKIPTQSILAKSRKSLSDIQSTNEITLDSKSTGYHLAQLSLYDENGIKIISSGLRFVIIPLKIWLLTSLLILIILRIYLRVIKKVTHK